MGLARTSKVNMTIDELNTLLTEETDNDKVDTIPEMIKAFESGDIPVPVPTDMEPMSNMEIENLLND